MDVIRNTTLINDDDQSLNRAMRGYCGKQNSLDDRELRTRRIVQHFVLIAANSGLKVEEQRQLRWSDVHIEHHTVNGLEQTLARIHMRVGTSAVRASRTFLCRNGQYFERLREIANPTHNDGFVFSLDGDNKLSKRTLLYHWHTIMKLAVQDIELLKSINPEVRSKCEDLLEASKSQLRQDLFVLSELEFKKNGYFVEFGATNGIDLSNSFLLEKEFGWNGILAEPARIWHSDLKKNRTVSIENKCVWRKSGEILWFNEAEVGELSTIDDFSNCDVHSESRKSGKRYNVETISLIDLLKQFGAPQTIDYLSIDTEGSEYEILQDFDFKLYKFNVITCEHNNTLNRDKIYDLLVLNGYERKFEHLSKFDDWYVQSSSFDRL